ncbi:MAG TPA: glutamate--cysteine ligase [Trebonia sp.]|jgi:carboxylate-amine ligase|nr:glutamate--cysteine ligase [Trebonia sp.]
MTIEWNPSQGPTLGVEWEVQLVDAGTRMLRQDAREVLAGLDGLGENGEHPKMKHELMQSTVEVVTGICGTVAEVIADLAVTIKDLQRAAQPHGIVIASSGAHAMSDWRDAKMAPSQRYAELLEQIQWPARRMQICATQVHVGLRDGERAAQIVNALATYIPHFLALTASSPYWSGSDTGLASARSVVFGALPNTGPPPLLNSWEHFEEFMGAQIRSGVIRSIKEIWWDIRPHPDYGTVEIRICDAVPTFREIGMLAALSQCLVQLLDSQLDRGYGLPSRPAWVVHNNKWRAIRYGLDATVITDENGATALLRDEVFELLRELEPVAWRLGCAEELAVADEVLQTGASYERQRAMRAYDGELGGVVDALITEFAEDRFVLPGGQEDLELDQQAGRP